MVKPLQAVELASMREAIDAGHIHSVFGLRAARADLHSRLVMGEQLDDFPVVWQTGRLLDKDAQPEDALFYLERAAELEPTNTKALGRLIKHYLKLHEEMPNRGYNYDAYGRACALLSLEQSEFVNELYRDVLRAYEQGNSEPEVFVK